MEQRIVGRQSHDDAGLKRRSWKAKLAAPQCDEGQGTRASFVATTFAVRNVPPRAKLHISAFGLYRAFLNGQRVGQDVLTPGWTAYDDRVDFQSYEVSELLVEGENRLEIWLGDGWFRSPMFWRDKVTAILWGERVAAIAEIVSGDELLVATGPDWQSGLLPITGAGIYYGEDYDARLQTLEATHGVDILPVDPVLFVAAETGPVRELEPLPAIDKWDDEGRTVFDFGQNAAGYVRLTARGEAGATIRIEHAEVVGPQRVFDNRNLRSARAEAHYVLRGGGEESWQPIFTFMGFRYVRATVTGDAEITDIRSIPISSVPEVAGGISTAVPEVNQLVRNTIWSQRSNFIEVPTDCPQRDERKGWTGDAQVFAGTACWLADSHRFLRKYLRDVVHDQRIDGAIPYFSPDATWKFPDTFDRDSAGSTGWGDVITVMPWQLYLHYGDTDVLRACFPAMLRWLDFVWNISGGPIVRPTARWSGPGFTFGDWLQPIGDNRKPRPTIGDDCAATLYHFISTTLAARIAGVIGDSGRQAQLEERAEEIRDAFRSEYIAPSGRLAHNDQTSYALSLLHGLVPEDRLEGAKSYFRRVVAESNYLIGTGFIGTPALLPALTRAGMADVAESVFLNRNVPGWLYQVERGATTIWERWDAIAPDGSIYEPTMNSYNHYAYGAVCQWLFEDVAGISPTPEGPGFDQVRVAPTALPALGHVEMWHECRHGRIEAGWVLDGDRVRYSLSLPEGCTGTIDGEAYPGLQIGGEDVGGIRRTLSGRCEMEFDLQTRSITPGAARGFG